MAEIVFRAPSRYGNDETVIKDHREAWDLAEGTFCVYCGKQPVFVEGGEGDYYVGPVFFCVSCLGEFTNPSGSLGVTVYRQARADALQGG